ncbi:MAG: succinylglutamate desuccinylase/aspartoacylase family protein [Candidatus Paceibacterota bacterium]
MSEKLKYPVRSDPKDRSSVDSASFLGAIMEKRATVSSSTCLERRLETISEILALKNVFESLSKSTYEGISGVVRIDGQKPGPVVGITVCTHGNEPAGLAAANYVLSEVASHTQDIAGTIFIVLNNIRATANYFNATTAEEARKARFVDVNMNRLPKDVQETGSDTQYETRRARELQKVWGQFDIGFDIHSTSQDSDPMIISMGDQLPLSLVHGMPIKKVISNIDEVQIGKPSSHYYGLGKSSARRIGIEAGTHEKTETFQNAVRCTQVLLQNAGVLSGEVSSRDSEYEEYVVMSAVMFPNASYELTRLFKDFELIPKGTVLAKGDGADIVAEHDCCSMFASKIKPDSLQEEVMFLTKPVRVH